MSGSNSGALFNATYYLQNNPDVVAAIAKGQFTSAMDHFNKFGQYENRSPNIIFNGAQYLINNPDIAAAVGSRQLASAWAHFTSFGIAELRNSGVFSGAFNEAAYLSANPDVAAAVKAGSFINGYQHFLLFGQNEVRSGTPALATGQTFTLTTGVDNLVGAATGNNTFIAFSASGLGAATDTLSAADIVQGKGTGNVFSLTNTANTADATSGAQISGIQSFNIRNTAATGSSTTLDASKIVGLTAVNSNAGTGDVIVTNLASGASAGIVGNGTLANGNLTASYVAAATAASLNLSGGVTTAGLVTVNGAGITSTVVNSTGAANKLTGGLTLAATDTSLVINAGSNLTVGTITAAALTGITVSGVAANVTLGTAPATVKTIDASGLTAGGVTVTTGATLTAFTGGAGNNTLTLGAAPTAGATVKFGAGNDKLLGTAVVSNTFSADGGTGNNTLSSGLLNAGNAGKFTNFQTLSLQSTQPANSTVPVFDVSLVGGITGLSIDAQNAGAATETTSFSFVALTSGQALTIAGRTVTAGTGGSTAADVASAFATGTSTNTSSPVDATKLATVSGSLSGYTSALSTSPAVLFTSTAAGVNVADLVATTTTATTLPTPTTVQGGGALPIYSNVTQGQGLTDTFVGSIIGNTNTLNFSGLSGTANTYTNTFAGAAQTAVSTGPNVQEGILALTGINNVNIVSGGGANTWNSVTLGSDLYANTVVISGAQNLNLAFTTGFGAILAAAPTATPPTLAQTGVTLIDGTTATGKLNINEASVTGATAGIAVKGGTGNDTITTSSFASTLTGGGGADSFNVGLTAVLTGGTSTSTTFTTISDAIVGDKITFLSPGTVGGVVGAANLDQGFNNTAATITGATLSGALDNAAAYANTALTTGQTKEVFFNFGTGVNANTYVLQHVMNAGAGVVGAGDVFVKLNTISLTSALSYNQTTSTLTVG